MEFVSAILIDVASSAPQAMIQNLLSTLGELGSVDDGLEELRVTYKKIQAMPDQLDCWQINNTAMEPLLQYLVRYCYEIEDLVDEIMLSNGSVKCSIPRLRQLTIPGQIAALQKKLEDIIKMIERILPAEASISKQPHNRVKLSPYCNSLLLDKPHLVAGTSRDDDKQSIILRLISQQHPHSGVSIIGMDGLGKTTLARTILYDEKITKHFSLILFAHVSGDFNTEDIVQELVEYHSPHNYHQPTEPHQKALQDILRGYTSLIILDDLWSVTDEAWDDFRRKYLNSSQDWKILTTTRSPKVAEVTESTSFYLNGMTDEDCKKLIIDRAGLSILERKIWSNEIEVISKKCKGMPIIANKLGLRLSKKPKSSERKDTIRQFEVKELWELDEFKEVFPSLNLNEPKLSPYLRRCFAYCSLFPPNHEFNRDDLMQLLEVEGFIQPQQTSVFDDLLSRSIFHPSKTRGKNQGIYKMHEFNHKFAHHLASKAFCRVDEGTSDLLSFPENIRHLSLACQNIDEPLLKKIEQCTGLRTFLLLHQDSTVSHTLSYNFFHKLQSLQSLRLLDLSHTNIANQPESIFSKYRFRKPKFPSKNLRYLDLSYTEIEKLPELHILHALQILKLKNRPFRKLPKDLNQLISLKHFQVNMKNLACPPSSLGMLTNLETLNSFHVGKAEGFKVTELKNMGHLREIYITGLENIGDKEEAQKAMLSQKSSLRTLKLEWDKETPVPNATAVLEGLQPHEHLDDLVVKNYHGQEFPPWLISPASQLVSIKLVNCQNCHVLPSLGQLAMLETLVIHSIPKVEIVDDHFYGQGERVFPCLELLEFRDMEGLANWTGLEAEHMPRLNALRIFGCPKLVNLPSLEHLSCLVNLEINDCPILPSLPELPASMNSELGELIIMDSALVTERCQTADWEMFKKTPYVEIDGTRILTKSPPDDDKDKVPINEHQPPTSANLDNENKVSEETRSGDQPTSSQLQPIITNQMAGSNHNLQRNDGGPPAPSARHISQHEGPRSERLLPVAPPEPVDESPSSPRKRKTAWEEEEKPTETCTPGKKERISYELKGKGKLQD